MKRRSSVQQLTFSALLTTLMLILGYIESRLPVPGLPGVKLGLSNSVLMLSLYWMGLPSTLLLMLLKVLLSGLLFGGVTGMLYAFAGGLTSVLLMALLIRTGVFSPVGVGIAGAAMHNIAQVLCAMWVLHTGNLVYYMAILVLIAAVTGIATGTVARLLMKHIPPAVRRKVRRRDSSENDG